MMSRMPYIIEVEAIDGAGKSTAVDLLCNLLSNRGLKVMKTREVGAYGHDGLQQLRSVALNPDGNFTGKALEMMMGAMRFQNHDLYQKSDADVIVCDRGLLSHLAYTDHWVDPDFVSKFYLNFVLPQTYAPNSVLYLDVDTMVASSRRSKRNESVDVVEARGDGFQSKVRQSFENYINQLRFSQPDMSIFRIDANQQLDQVASQIGNLTQNILITSIKQHNKGK